MKQQVTYTTDKIPPQALDIEKVVIGALMTEPNAIQRVESLTADDFYSEVHKTIFRAIRNLADRRRAVDMLTTTNELKAMGELDNVGGAYFVTEMCMGVGSAAHLSEHANILKQKALARKLISMSTEVQEMSYNQMTDIGDVFEFIEKRITDLTIGVQKSEASTMDESLSDTIDYIQKIQYNAEHGIKNSVETGLYEMTKHFNGGWAAPDLIILGGRPSMGKTQAAIHFAKNAAMDGKKPLFISIEMTKIQLVLRMITENNAIDFYKIKTGQLSPEEWRLVDEAIAKISQMEMRIADDNNIQYLGNIKSLARSYARKGELGMIIIDYLQLIRTGMSFGTRDLEIGYITRELKALAKELNVPIMLLAQLNRGIKGAKVTCPKLEDLRESGNIEQDADIVIFIHRPSYYDNEAIDDNGDTWNLRGYFYIAKYREGERDAKIYFEHDEYFKKIIDPTNVYTPMKRNYMPQEDDGVAF